MSEPTRDTIFVSHANREDNAFALWLTLRLVSAGYAAWCDLTKLLGGETFWDDAEAAIRTRTAKFCYVLSRTSNAKDGPLRELQVAQAVAKSAHLQNFVVPLLVDDLPHGDVTIELQRILGIGFNKSWAAGLSQLLSVLERDGVPRTGAASKAVAAWWTTAMSAGQGLRAEREEYVSNVFPVAAWPEKIWYHELGRDSIGKIEIPDTLPFPAAQDGVVLISFASAADLAPHLGILKITRSREDDCGGWHRGECPRHMLPHVTRLLKLAWLSFVSSRGLPLHPMANGIQSFYFRRNSAENDVVSYKWTDDRRGSRQVIGYKTITNLRTQAKSARYWHYGADAKPMTYPWFGYAMRSHVLFSDDGNSIWDDPDRLHAARANQCKNWWNDAWRDRLFGTMSWLAGGADLIALPVGDGKTIKVRPTPLVFASPVSYDDPGEAGWSDDEDIRDSAQQEGEADETPA